MSRRERKLVTAIRDAASRYLEANNHAENYIYSREFANAVADFTDEALKLVPARTLKAAK